jgi:type VI secretion system secreted protein Hcp
MAGSMWMKIDGVEGEANDDGHQKEIDVEAYGWGLVHPISPKGGGGSAGETTAHELQVTKHIDKASFNLMKLCFSGKHMDKVLLTVRKRGESPIDYVKYTMKNALVSSWNQSGSADAAGTESVSFSFDAVETEYTPQGPDGKAQGAVTAKWDLKKNKEG